MLPDALLTELATETVDIDGKPMPLTEQPFLKEAPDFKTFVKSAYDAHREVGARIPLKIAKPEDAAAWRTENLPKLYKAGVLEAPPATPADYNVVKPDSLPAEIGWNEESAKEFTTILHKHGAGKALAGELLQLHEKMITGAQKYLKTSLETAMVALKAEHGDKFAERQELAKRLTSQIFKSPEELAWFEEVGLGDHPGFLSVLLRLAPLAAQDSSFMSDANREGSSGDSAAGGDELRAQIADIMSNPANPKYKLYHQRDKATLAEIDNMYKKVYGTGQVVIG